MNFIKTYVPRALIGAIVYCIPVVIFLSKETYQSVWVLFVGNIFYMLTMAILIYRAYRVKNFEDSPVNSAISGHILSLTGAALSVIFSLILYFIFLAINGTKGESLQQAPAGLAANSTHGMLFILMILAAFGNTVAGFFAALFTSFDSTKEHAG